MAVEKRTVIMCAEAVPWRCHRSLVGDALLVRGVEVEDIMSEKSSRPHKLTPWAQVDGLRDYLPEKRRMMENMRLQLYLLTAILLVGSCAAAATWQQQQAPPPPASRSAQTDWMALSSGITQEQLPDLEAQLQSNPEDLTARSKLLSFYTQVRDSQNYSRHLLWVVEHHPEAQMLDWAMNVAPAAALLRQGGDYDSAKALWEQNLINNGSSPEVVYHAALFFRNSDLQQSAQLLGQARGLMPSNPKYLDAQARIYVDTYLDGSKRLDVPANQSGDAEGILQAQLQGSTDAALLSRIGSMLVSLGREQSNERYRRTGMQLLEQAVVTDPSNPRWKEALASANVPTGPVRVGGQVAEANLLSRVEPVYPPLALGARVQGTVEFMATIGPDGRVENLQLVRGHPLLVNAAKTAVLQWTYRPTLLNGNPVTVITNVVVPFQLPPPQ